MRRRFTLSTTRGTDHSPTGVLGALLFAAVLGVYANSLRGPMVFDDLPTVADNPSIRHGWALWQSLVAPAGGLTVSGRPIANLSIAINYLISGEAVWSYHVFNLLIHGCAALALFGLIRRTTGQAWPAWGLALLWAVHPLQTESVTYIAQRVESMEGLFLLLTLYWLARAEDSPLHLMLSVLACALGMATKESMAVAPVIALLYDRTYLAGSFSAAWCTRWRYYAGLAATWVILALLLASDGGNRGGTVGLGSGVPVWDYWLTQFPAIIHYLRLSFWPAPLVFEYGKFWEPGLSAVWPQALAVFALAIGSIVAWVRWPRFGFLCAAFFLLLAPTSLAPGTKQMIVEHRMYLPLAAVICAVGYLVASVLQSKVARVVPNALGSDRGPTSSALGTTCAAICIVLAVPLAAATVQRNRTYRSELALWRDTVEKRPANSVARCNYGAALFEAGDRAAAIDQYHASLALDSTNSEAEYDLANALAQTGRVAEALAAFESALGKAPADAKARCNYADTLILARRPGEALEQFGLALRLEPASARTHNDLGFALAGLGRISAALSEYDQAARLRPTDPSIAYNRGSALAQANRPTEAVAEDRRAIRLKPEFPEAHNNLANLLARSGRPIDALPEYAEALRERPDYWQARFNWANALFELGRVAEARAQLQEVLRLNPGFQPAVDALK